jgi:DtxR family transcriptional regulator, Mn-dependent transcriptional regulator
MTASHPPVLTGPVEDYLKAIYDLERAVGPATTNGIALRLAISPASVSRTPR